MGEQNKMIPLHDNHGDKFVKLRNAMDEWSRKNAGISIDSPKGRQYSDDWDRYLKLSELFKFHKPDFIKKKHMLELNELYRRYNG
jgi:hypothetical protein